MNNISFKPPALYNENIFKGLILEVEEKLYLLKLILSLRIILSMTRINHAATYYMPLLCSNRPYVRISTLTLCSLIYVTFYLFSKLLASEYKDDPQMFKPDAQDYFRTMLLGVFSPYVFIFFKRFIINIKGSYILSNLFVDFFINDWFLFCILIGLAYPQVQNTIDASVNHHLDHSPSVWQIIPRQSFLFGIAWSLGEFSISIISNLSTFQEIPSNSPHMSVTDHTNTSHGPTSINRQNITLSKCVGIRRVSSSISSNVYSSDLTKYHSKYGSIDDLRNETATTKTNEDGKILIVDPSDNSLRLTSSILEASNTKQPQKDPILYKSKGFVWIRYHEDNTTLRRFYETTSPRDLFLHYLFVFFILVSNIMLLVGESLMLSMYFIYVPKHDTLFTGPVNYFGRRTITYYLLCAVLPFTTINFMMNIIVLFWNDIDEWCNGHSTTTSVYQNKFLQKYFSCYTDIKKLQQFKRSNNVTSSAQPPFPYTIPDSPIFLNDSLIYYNRVDTKSIVTPSKWTFKAFIRYTMDLWKDLSGNDAFVILSTFLWSLVIFITGILCSIAV